MLRQVSPQQMQTGPKSNASECSNVLQGTWGQWEEGQMCPAKAALLPPVHCPTQGRSPALRSQHPRFYTNLILKAVNKGFYQAGPTHHGSRPPSETLCPEV